MCSQFTQPIQRINTAFMRIHADLGVKIPALIANFAHIAKHQQLASRRACEHVDGGTH